MYLPRQYDSIRWHRPPPQDRIFFRKLTKTEVTA
jgi:hypothetical protein